MTRTPQESRPEWLNLSPHNLPWTAEGVARARRIVAERCVVLARAGWQVAEGKESFAVLPMRKSEGASVIVGARLALRRAPPRPVSHSGAARSA